MTLVGFLLARLDELVAVAENADGETYFLDDGEYTGRLLEAMPASRILLDADAKRVVILAEMDRIGTPAEFISVVMADTIRGRADSIILRALAGVYSDHPDYRQEWKP